MAADWTNDPPFVGPTRHVGGWEEGGEHKYTSTEYGVG